MMVQCDGIMMMYDEKMMLCNGKMERCDEMAMACDGKMERCTKTMDIGAMENACTSVSSHHLASRIRQTQHLSPHI